MKLHIEIDTSNDMFQHTCKIEECGVDGIKEGIRNVLAEYINRLKYSDDIELDLRDIYGNTCGRVYVEEEHEHAGE